MGGGWEGGRFKRVGTCVMFTIDSHCRMAETNTLQSSYPPFKTNFKKKKTQVLDEGFHPMPTVSADTPMCFLQRSHHYGLGYFPRLP